MATTQPGEDRLSVEQVVRDQAPRIYSIARRMLGNDADAEDVTQEVLLQVVRKLDTFRGESSIPTWLHRVTVNAALGLRRQRSARDRRHSPEPVAGLPEPGGPVKRWTAPDQQLLDRETQERIESAIAGLDEKYRDVYVLADVEGLSNAEIGSLLGLGLPAVKSRLHRARLMMRDALAPYFEETTP
jgi:RNA polymerase sigma-70 factor (ECF subfamily)